MPIESIHRCLVSISTMNHNIKQKEETDVERERERENNQDEDKIRVFNCINATHELNTELSIHLSSE